MSKISEELVEWCNSVDVDGDSCDVPRALADRIDAEMVEIQPIPANGDVLAYATSDASQVNANTIVSAGGERDVWSVVLTSAQNQNDRQVSRSFKITYYIWGIPMSVTAKYN